MAISDMLRSGKKKLNGHKLHDAESLFRAIDEDFSGTADRGELRRGLKKLKIGATIAQLEAWIDALDVNGDGSIEEDEFVGFMEGSLNPDSQNFLAEGAAQLKIVKPKLRSPLVVDKILHQDRLSTSERLRESPTIITFIQTLQELERLYIHRRTYQKKIKIASSTAGTDAKRGVGVDLLLDVETVKDIQRKEDELSRMIAQDSTFELERFFTLWHSQWERTHSEQNDQSLPSSIVYEVEMKRRGVHLKPESPAWKAAISPRKELFSHSGSLTESAQSDAWLLSKQDIHEKTGRYRMTKANILGMNTGESPSREYYDAKLTDGKIFGSNNDRYVLGLGGRRNSDFAKYASPSSTVNQARMYGSNGSHHLSHSSPSGFVPELNNSLSSGKKYLSARARVEASIQRYKKSGATKRAEVAAAMY
jgi:hypothetical protein